MAKTLYEALGVSRAAPKEEIETICLRLGEELRSGKSDSPEAKARFAEIERAYETLVDDQSRSEYDKAVKMVEELERKRGRQGKFFGWGITFLIIGVLSFVIPLLGKQFIVIVPFVAMGLHPGLVGLLFIVTGGSLIAMARSG